jgi:ABC-type multidrug transport system fused ATPase/permease subunit
MSKKTEDVSILVANEKGNVKSKSPPAEKPFRFFPLLAEIHSMVVRLEGYPSFMLKYIPLQLLRLGAAVSFLIVAHVIADELDLENLAGTHRAALICVGVVNILGRLTPFLTRMSIDRLKESLQATQATAIVAKVFDLPHSTMLTTPTGEFGQLIGKVFRNLDTLLPALYGAVIPLAVETVVAVMFIGVVYGWIAFVQLVFYLAYTVLSFRMAKRKAQRNKELLMAFMTEWGKLLASAGSYERAHFFGNVDREVKCARTAFENLGKRITAVSEGEHREGMVLMGVSLVVTGGFVVLILQQIELEGIELVALIFYFVTFVGSLEQYSVAMSNLRTAVFEYQTFHEFIDRMSDVTDLPDAVELEQKTNPSIVFKNVSFSYGGKQILDNVSFKVEGGQTLGLVGSSGCGKSTVLRLLLRFYQPSAGQILVDGMDIRTVTGKSLRKLFSVVSQDAQLFNGTVRENIEYGKLGSSDAEMVEAAKLAGLTISTAPASPDDSLSESDITLDKICGEKGAKLSGGQQQRVSLARAILKNGTIFLLDEPTTGLDGVVAKKLQQTLDVLSKEATTICITHHLEDLRSADTILYLDGGRIVESGAFDKLLDQGGEFFKQVEARKAM